MTQDSKPQSAKPPGKKLLGAGNLTLAVMAVAAAWALWLGLADGDAAATDDAYVDGNIVQVTPQLNGSVTMIAADNTDYVKAGQPLIQLNQVDTRLGLDKAQAQLARAVRQVRVQFANAGQMQANLSLRAADLEKARADLARRRQLAQSGAISGEDIMHAEDGVKTAQAAYTVAEQQLMSSQAMVDRTSIASHPDVLNAAAQLRDAYVANTRTVLRAPVSGIVSKRNVQLGQRVTAGAALMSIVAPEQMWVNANFKESQLRHIRIGQRVRLHADVYGKDVVYSGKVIGQEAGTGNAFSLLPAQNASGNWIKVVQRVPVRIALDAGQLAAHPLKLGLSMHAEIDTGDRSGKAAMEQISGRPAYQTDVFSGELEQADLLVQSVIAASLAQAPRGKAN